jgi:hypothetical protein
MLANVHLWGNTIYRNSIEKPNLTTSDLAVWLFCMDRYAKNWQPQIGQEMAKRRYQKKDAMHLTIFVS